MKEKNQLLSYVNRYASPCPLNASKERLEFGKNNYLCLIKKEGEEKIQKLVSKSFSLPQIEEILSLRLTNHQIIRVNGQLDEQNEQILLAKFFHFYHKLSFNWPLMDNSQTS